MNLSPRARAILAALIAVITGGIVITVTDNGPNHGPGKPRGSVTIVVGGAQFKDKTVTIPAPAVAIAKEQARQDAAGNDQAAESNLKAETPTAAAPATLERNLELKPPGQPAIPPHLPLAAAELAGCRTYLVRNYSSRGGSPILLGVTHWTASRDTSPSWAGILGNVKWFDTAAAQASSNEVTDRGGRCALTVPEALKPWTQANYNRVSVSVEITNDGAQMPLVLAGAGFDRLVALYVGWHHRWGIPLQRGRVYTGLGSACPTVYKPGIVEHVDLGACGGGHPDVAHSPVVDQAIAAARAIVYGSSAPRPAAGKYIVRACQHVEGNRVRERRGHTTAAERAHARRHLRDARRRGFACGPKGIPVRIK